MGKLSFRRYQQQVKREKRDLHDKNIKMKLAIQLFEESGNVTSIIRRSIKNNFHEKEVDIEELKKEIKDVVHCIVQLINQLEGASLEQIVKNNWRKTEKNYRIKDFKYNGIMAEFFRSIKTGCLGLNFGKYQKYVTQTYLDGLPEEKEQQARFFAMGLMKEIGRISELLGEHLIDGATLNRYRIEEKLGDTLWYLAAICETYEISLEEIMVSTIQLNKKSEEEEKAKKVDKNFSFKEYAEGISGTLQKHFNTMSEEDKNRELVLGVFEEGGEVTSLCSGMEVDKDHLKEELGDVLYYIAQLANRLPNMDLPEEERFNLEKVARFNLEKTHTRYQKSGISIEDTKEFTFSDYVSYAKETEKEGLPESQEERLQLFSLGLIKEIGKISELYTESRINSTTLDVYKIKEKLGDALWYLTAIARTSGLELGEIASANVWKVNRRYMLNKQEIEREEIT